MHSDHPQTEQLFCVPHFLRCFLFVENDFHMKHSKAFLELLEKPMTKMDKKA